MGEYSVERLDCNIGGDRYNSKSCIKWLLIHLNYNGIMEMDRPPTCKCTWVEDGKQEIYLEWPNLWFYIHIRSFSAEQQLVHYHRQTSLV